MQSNIMQWLWNICFLSIYLMHVCMYDTSVASISGESYKHKYSFRLYIQLFSILECIYKCISVAQFHKNTIQRSQFSLAINCQVISRFCLGRKCHYQGFSMDTFGTKWQMLNAFWNCRSSKLGKSCVKIILKCYIS